MLKPVRRIGILAALYFPMAYAQVGIVFPPDANAPPRPTEALAPARAA